MEYLLTGFSLSKKSFTSYHIGVLHARLSNLKVRGYSIEKHTIVLQRMRGWVGCEINTSTVFNTHKVLINQGFVILMVCSDIKIKRTYFDYLLLGNRVVHCPFSQQSSRYLQKLS